MDGAQHLAMRARFLSALVFLAAIGLALAMLRLVGGVAFAFTAMAGCFASEILFRALATPDERRLDLEERVRNPPL
jgi:hypothetical protein